MKVQTRKITESVLPYSAKPLSSDIPVAAFSLLLGETKIESRPHPSEPLTECCLPLQLELVLVSSLTSSSTDK